MKGIFPQPNAVRRKVTFIQLLVYRILNGTVYLENRQLNQLADSNLNSRKE